MENSTIPQSPVQEVPQTVAPTQTKSKFWLLFLGLFLLGIFFLGGTYLFVTSQKSPSTPTQITNQTLDTQKDIKQLDVDTASLEMKDIESDFTEVDQELKNL